jgi:dTDP-glucose pyrophosphorylase
LVGRGELEITDVNNAYIRRGAMEFSRLEGFWSDAGTFESLLRASVMVRDTYLVPDSFANPRTVDVRSRIGESKSGV